MDNHNQQNLFISAATLIVLTTLLWVGSHTSGTWLALAAIVYSFIGLTNYALIHEACHRNLNSNTATNWLLGAAFGWFFPVSFTFMETVHQVHHLNNRTDSEMFDYYYPDDNLLIKYGQWYSILIGIYPPIIPIGSVLLALTPSFFNLYPWKAARSSSIIFDRNLFTKQILNKIRLEVFSGVLFWLFLFMALDLQILHVLIMYIAFWVNWSTRQYVTHAFSPRDVIQGAWNLKVSKLMGWIFLNGHWDKVHHQYPNAPWQKLSQLGKDSQKPISYWKQYFSLWRGPRPNTESAPKALTSIPH